MHATGQNDIRRERGQAPGRSSAADRIHGRWQAPPAGQRRGVTSWDGLSLACLLFQHPTDVDEVVGDDAEPDPALHSDSAFVAAAVEPVSPFDHADAPLASGSPSLAVAEPALFLLALALSTFGGAIGNADAFDASRFRRSLILGGVEPSVCRHQTRRASELRLVGFDGRDQQVRIARPLIIRLHSRDIGDNSADEVMLDRAPASQDYHPEIVDDAPGGTPCSLDGRTGTDPVDEGSRNIGSVSALEASAPKKLGTQPGELNAGVQCAGSAHEAVESRTQSNAIAEENLDIADCPAVDEVRLDRAFASQDSQTQADPIANEILEIADGPALDVAPGGIPGSPGGRTEANPVADGLLIPSVPAVETQFPQPPASQSAKPHVGMHRASHGVVTSRSWPMLTRLLLLAVFALFLTALFASMFQ